MTLTEKNCILALLSHMWKLTHCTNPKNWFSIDESFLWFYLEPYRQYRSEMAAAWFKKKTGKTKWITCVPINLSVGIDKSYVNNTNFHFFQFSLWRFIHYNLVAVKCKKDFKIKLYKKAALFLKKEIDNEMCF